MANNAGQGTGNTSGTLSKALASLGLGGGDTSNTAALGALTGLLSAYGHYAQSKAGSSLPSMPAMGALPTLPGSTSTGYGPAGGYNYSNYSGNSNGTGNGYAPRAQAPAAPAASYYTYGSGPEQQFFQQVKPGTIAPVTGSAEGGHISMARGGAVPGFDMGGMVNSGGLQNVLGQGALAQPGQTPMTPRPMMQAGQQPMRPPGQMQAGQTPMTPRPMMQAPQQPQQPQQPMRPPQMPTGAPQRPQAPPSTMMQRMQQPTGRQMASGGPTGGALSQMSGPEHPSGPEHGSRYIQGSGDGTSDSIPARLANGEYVIDSQAVSMLGNGDNSAGAKRLDEFRKNLRTHKGGALSRGKMAPDAKPIHKYMGD
jgi:hypothetical protein